MTNPWHRCLALVLLAALLHVPAAALADPGSQDLGDLPLVALPAHAGGAAASAGADPPPLAVLLTGDGGYASLDQQIGGLLPANGVPFVALNSLRYYWTRRTPDEAARDVARIIDHYLDAWSLSRVVLIGYSFGADVMPFIVNRLPAELRSRVDGIVLIGPGESATFEIRLTEWIPALAPKGLPLGPELALLGEARLMCIYGTSERRSSCLHLPQKNARLEPFEGGHHMGGKYDDVAHRILGFVR